MLNPWRTYPTSAIPTKAHNGVVSAQHTDPGVIILMLGLRTPNISPTNVYARSWVSLRAPDAESAELKFWGYLFRINRPIFSRPGELVRTDPTRKNTFLISPPRPQKNLIAKKGGQLTYSK